MKFKIKILKKILEKSDNKFNIFSNKNILNKFNCNIDELCDLIDTFLTDEQIVKLFDFQHFFNLLPSNKQYIFNLIKDNNLKLSLIKYSDFLSNMTQFQIFEVIKSLDDYSKTQILNDNNFLTKYEMDYGYITKIIFSLDDTSKMDLLSNHDYIENQLKLSDVTVCDIIISIQNEELRLQMLDICKLEPLSIRYILKECSDNCKVTTLLQNKYNFRENDIIFLLSSMDVDSLITFINNHNNFLHEKGLSPYNITKKFNTEQQLEFVKKFENINLPINEKRKILATLKQATKDNLDISNYPEEYKTAIQMKLNSYNMIVPDLDGNLDQYKDLEDLLYINPIDMTQENKEKLSRLFEIFPTLKVSDSITSVSTIEEFKNGEDWIQYIIQQLNPEWSDIQKIAFIDNAIGKKISYSPDFDTEVHNSTDARAIWKIIDSGYGVCAGIALLEQYILNQIGINAEYVESDNHAFIMLKDIEIKTADGNVLKGNTIIDPTWNLTAHKYGFEPSNFCRSYEEIRRHDTGSDGVDCLAHKNDKELSNATLDLDRETLRQIYTSIGIADKDGTF